MLLSAVYVLVVAQSSSEVTEGLMNNPVYMMHGHTYIKLKTMLVPSFLVTTLLALEGAEAIA